MGFLRDGVNELAGEANPDTQDGWRERGQQPIVVSASAPQALPVLGECEAGDEDDSGRCRIGLRALSRVGLQDAKGAGFQLREIAEGMENEMFAGDPW